MQHIVSGTITQLPIKPLQTNVLQFKKKNNIYIYIHTLKLWSVDKLNQSSGHSKEEDYSNSKPNHEKQILKIFLLKDRRKFGLPKSDYLDHQ